MRIKYRTLLSMLFLLGGMAAFSQSPPPVYSIDANTLLASKKMLTQKNAAVKPAYEQLLEQANKALEHPLVSVMEKTQTPPSGDKHDYMSLAPYHWPDPTKADGLPYIRKDGDTNPEVKLYKDKEYLPSLCNASYTLALAWYLSEDQKYAAHAAKLMRKWFLDPATKMNPNLNFGQAVKGVNTGRGSGLIDTRHLIKLIDAAQLLQGSKEWSAKDQEGLKQWFKEFLNWMQTSPVGMDELDANNNHGMWYDAQRLSMALFTGQKEAASKIVSSLKQRLEAQLDANGLFPLELARTNSLHYSSFVLEAYLVATQLSTNTDQDLWKYQSASGASVGKAVKALFPFLTKEKQWGYPNLKPYDYKEALEIIFRGYRALDPQKASAAIKSIAGDKADQLLFHLIIQIVQ